MSNYLSGIPIVMTKQFDFVRSYGGDLVNASIPAFVHGRIIKGEPVEQQGVMYYPVAFHTLGDSAWIPITHFMEDEAE